ncbi:MAG TPA: hypothetical protein VFA99_10860 [Acidobacteriaceae bacterium]|nr:hypothetical protein [Acidobacteriaceae bacterium]
MASSVDVSTRTEKPRQRVGLSTRDLLLALPFLAVIYVELVHHVLWRDELNALGIVWASPTIPSLFWHVHHEGHPWLWYMVLWIPSRFTQSVLVLKWVQGIVSTAIILFVALRSPFRRWEKALLLAGYFFVFEYTVLSRMYGVMLLAFVIYMYRRVKHRDSPIGSAVLLGVMASVDTIGIILSLALLLEYACATYRSGRLFFSRRAAAIALGVYAAITAFAVWSAKPAKDISWRTTGRPFAEAKDMSHLYEAFLRYTILPFLSVKSPRSHFFWNPWLHRDLLAYTLPMLVILAMIYWAFRSRWNLLVMIGATIVAGTLLSHLIYPGSERHFGVVFLAFVAAAWIVRAEHPAELLPWPVYVLLGVSALCSIWAVAGQWVRPFSYDKAAAEWIVQNHLEGMPLVAEGDTSAVGVAEYLRRPVYMIECSCVDTYLLFSSRRDNFTDADAPARILQAERFYHDQPLLFLREYEMKPEEAAALKQEGFEIQPLATFKEAEEIAEDFYFYRLTLRPTQSGNAAE